MEQIRDPKSEIREKSEVRLRSIAGSHSFPVSAIGYRLSAFNACLLTLLGLLLSACTTQTDGSSVGSRTDISELNLLGHPLAVNLDDRPGADGVVVKLFAANQAHPRTLPLRSGTLEIAAYPGTPSVSALPPPFHLWTFTPSELAPYEFTTSLGTGYNLVLSWVPKLLTADRVTIIARYLPAAGKPVVSAPNSITAATH